MNIAFTICSNNYLAHAKTVGDSFLQFHPEFKFVIGLVDEVDNSIDYSQFSTFEIILLKDLKLSNLDLLVQKFNITELNTSVKPSFFKYFFEVLNASSVIYIDPDILVLSRFTEVVEMLKLTNIIITPHILTPVDDDFAPTDYHTLRGGVFNLGFLALSNYSKVKVFLDWWDARVIKYGFADFTKNMFYDQIWINYVPAFYDNYSILKHPGYNMSNWNLHERHLTFSDGNFVVNNNHPLRFFHFSSYDHTKPSIICAYQTRYNFDNRKDLTELFEKYQKLLLKNDIERIKKLRLFYFQKTANDKKNIRSLLKKIVRDLVRRIKTSLPL